MPKIVWEGNRKSPGTSHQSPPIPGNAEILRSADDFIGKSLPYGIAPMLLCMLAVFLKAFFHREPPVDPRFLIPGFVTGMLVALPLHELMHALCYPKGATVWIGLCLRKLAAYAVSYHPLTKKRFIMMSLAPSLLGMIPLAVFIAAPITMKPLLTICMIFAFMGLISPAPDYMDVVSVLRRAPSNAMICDSQEGLYFCSRWSSSSPHTRIS